MTRHGAAGRAAALLAGLSLFALAGCGGGEMPHAASPATRDAAVMIGSAALFDPGRFAGRWYVVADAPPPGRPACRVTLEDWQATGPGRFTVTGNACTAQGPRRFEGRATVIGPGRIDLDSATRDDLGGEPLWILWVDADYRMAAVGTPSGRFQILLSRSPVARPDLATAAGEVFSFNGYPAGQLKRR